MSKSFEGNLRKPKFYTRDEKEIDTDNAYFNSEGAEGKPDIEVLCSLTCEDIKYNFIWQRSNSNENLKKHKFTHYLSRKVYADDYRLDDGQIIGNEIMDIKTDERKSGMLGIILLDEFGYWNHDQDRPEIVLFLVEQKIAAHGQIKLLSCYPTDHDDHVALYANKSRNRKRPKIKHPPHYDSLDEGAIKFMKKMEETVKTTRHLFEKADREYAEALIEDLKRGYKIFHKILRSKVG
jgi:hypothetical protein